MKPEISTYIILCGVLCMMGVLSTPASAQRLEYLVRHADAVVQAQVSAIDIETGEHGGSVEVVTLHISDSFVRNARASTVVLRIPQMILDGPPIPKFKQGEEVIVCLTQFGTDWIVAGNSLGKFTVNEGTIENSSLSVEQFKSLIKEADTSAAEHIDWPDGILTDHGSSNGDCKLNEEFCLIDDPYFYGPLSGNTILLKINPDGAVDKDGNALSFSAVKSAIQRAVNTWNNAPHSYTTFSVSSSEYTGVYVSNNNESTVTFEDFFVTGAADVQDNNGIIDEVDLIFSSGLTYPVIGHLDLRWNTNSSYPSSYSLYENPFIDGTPPGEFDEIGPVDLEDIAAHELGHGVGLDHVANGVYTLHPTDYEINEWWEKTFRRSLEDGDKAGKVYQDPSITSTSQQIPHLLLGAPSTIDVTGSFTVPSGKTFEVESGKTLQFNANTGIFSRGEVILDDVTLEKDPSGGSFKYLYLYGSGADGSTITDVEISGSTYGIHTNNLSDTEMDGVSASDNVYQGLKIYNSSNIDVIGSTFENATYYGVYVDDSYNIYFKSGTRFEDNGYDGIAVRGYSSAFFGDGNEEADAVVKNNDRYGLNIYTNSLLTIGYTAGNFGGNNSVVSNSTYNARVTGTSGLVAEDTWWGSASESTILSTLYWDGSSTLDYTPWLTSPGPSKNAASPILVVGPEDADGLSNDELTPALLVKRYGELVARDRKQALAMLRALQNHANPEVGRAVRILLMRALLHDGKVAEGIAYGTDLLTDEALAVAGRAVVAKRLFYVYLLDLGDTRRALEMLALLAPLDEEDVENGLLATIYEHVTGAAPIIPEPSSAKRASEAAPRLTVYPNPFNPTATLRYTLVQQGPVRLTVLDLLGRDVAVLVDDVQQAGTHAVRFNGAGLASGVYFYRLDAGAEVLTGKMLLMK